MSLLSIIVGAAALATLSGCFMDGYPGLSTLDANRPDRDAQVRPDAASATDGAGPLPEDGGVPDVDAEADAAIDAAIDATADAGSLPASCSGTPLVCSAECTGTESCAPACLENAKCDNHCGASQRCDNVCPAGSVCNFDCDLSPECHVLCAAGSVCTVHTVDGSNARVTCEPTADCKLSCDKGDCAFLSCATKPLFVMGSLICPLL